MILKIISIVLLSYLLGSITGAYYITKWMTGKDIRELGSRNVGARNAWRQLGSIGFLSTFLIDLAKVLLALYITTMVFPNNEIMLLVSAFFLLLGHIWPVQLGFRGGKGVAVFLISTLWFVPVAMAILAPSFGFLYLFIRNFTVAGLISMVSIPITALVIGEYTFFVGLFILLIFVVASHVIKK